jgi:lipid IVA palmitoyltransferase
VNIGSIASGPDGRFPNGCPRCAGVRWCLPALLLALLAVGSPLAAAEDPADAWKSFSEKIDSTLPLALASPAAQAEGWWSGLWDGTKRIWTDGTQDFYLSGYFYHTPYGFPEYKRNDYNDNAWGGGYGRTLTEENNNQRMFYGLVARDSHQKPMYLAGYAWLARWDFVRDVRVGAGYSVLLIAHSTSTNYWPVPLLAPVLSIGTENAAIYGTYFNAIGYVFTKFSFGP